MLVKSANYPANIICDLKEYLCDYQVVSISIGPDNGYYILAVNNIPPRINGRFPQIQTSTIHNYKVIIVQWENVYTVNIDNQKWNYHLVQPIGNDRVILACARARYYGRNKYDLNGKIFDLNGTFIKEFLLGDGIEDLKVTENDVIWTSYFDEGVIGNYGWDDPIGSCGLRAWNQDGETVYTYNNSDSNFICDCYALNVVSDNEVWFYYYTDFLLGKIKGEKIHYYNPKLSGADGFSIYDRYVLFRGGYDNRDEYRLLEFVKGDNLKETRIITFTDENDKVIIADKFDCRGSRLILMVDSKLYSIDLIDIIWKD
ncbi:hypothetical protein [Acetivibrio cellulolyticus]|uniref:hypothetical protein n=1 Tax=Acetivibrio cellulolyticus TaxID=35830 RepID=UPI0001E2D549|nr:hypothetical protein [Acetivibrio cellulolyticus]